MGEVSRVEDTNLKRRYNSAVQRRTARLHEALLAITAPVVRCNGELDAGVTKCQTHSAKRPSSDPFPPYLKVRNLIVSSGSRH